MENQIAVFFFPFNLTGEQNLKSKIENETFKNQKSKIENQELKIKHLKIED